jgi:hypothetical protein
MYNIYTYYKNNYILYYEIDSPKNNQKTYSQESLKYKIKFVIYVLISGIALIMLIIRFIYFMIDFIFSDNERIKKFLRFFGIYNDFNLN